MRWLVLRPGLVAEILSDDWYRVSGFGSEGDLEEVGRGGAVRGDLEGLVWWDGEDVVGGEWGGLAGGSDCGVGKCNEYGGCGGGWGFAGGGVGAEDASDGEFG